jgi:hypothetical protein
MDERHRKEQEILSDSCLRGNFSSGDATDPLVINFRGVGRLVERVSLYFVYLYLGRSSCGLATDLDCLIVLHALVKNQTRRRLLRHLYAIR